jgi:hypothetical protein
VPAAYHTASSGGTRPSRSVVNDTNRFPAVSVLVAGHEFIAPRPVLSDVRTGVGCRRDDAKTPHGPSALHPTDPSVPVQLQLPSRQYDALDALARRQHTSVQEVIRRELRREAAEGQRNVK